VRVRVGEQLKEIWRQATGDVAIRASERKRQMDVAAEADAARKTLALPSILSPLHFPGKHLPKPTPANLRRFAETPLVRRAINVIKDRIAAMDWQVRLRRGVKPDDVAFMLRKLRALRRTLEEPNQVDSFRTLIEQAIEDALTHDIALWNGNDTSLSAPTTTQYMGAIAQIVAGGQTVSIPAAGSIVNGLKTAVATMCANTGFYVRPTAIYANPMLLDLIDQEMKAEFNVVLNTDNITGGIRVKMLSTQAGDLPLIPDWSLGYTGTIGSGSATLPAYIVTEDLIEYHWLGDPAPRIFQLGLPNSMTYQYVAVKFGAPVVKGANFAHYQVLVTGR
jgi:hypothetical protein